MRKSLENMLKFTKTYLVKPAKLTGLLTLGATLSTFTPNVNVPEADSTFNITPSVSQNSSRDEFYKTKILVDGSKVNLEKDNMLQVDVYCAATDTLPSNLLKNKEILTDSTKLEARYYLLSSDFKVPKANDKDFYKNLVYIGSNKLLKPSKPIVGMFVYNPDLPTTFDPESAEINPYANVVSKDSTFEFLVEVWKGDKKLTHKFWGENFKKGILEGDIKKDPFTFKFSKPKNKLLNTKYENISKEEESFQDLLNNLYNADDLTNFHLNSKISSINKTLLNLMGVKLNQEEVQIKSNVVNNIKSDYGKKVHGFNQKLSFTNTDMIKISDFYSVHGSEYDSNSKLTNRANKSYQKKKLKKMREINPNLKILNMVSNFSKKSILDIFNNPKKYAKEIVKNSKSMGYDGVNIDFENHKLTSANSDDFVNFMKYVVDESEKLTNESGNKFYVDVCLGPRFKDCEKGFSNLLFSNPGKMDTISGVDGILIMNYDFNVAHEGSSQPIDKKIKVLDFYYKNVKNKSKLVEGSNSYGRIFDSNGNAINGGNNAINERAIYKELLKKGAVYETSNGEVKITTKNRVIYGPTPFLNKKRFDVVNNYPGVGIALWKDTQTLNSSISNLSKWKQEAYNNQNDTTFNSVKNNYVNSQKKIAYKNVKR